jgi:serine/threonine-protein kinase
MTQTEKYRVVQKIDSGGMAEVFQGVAEGIQGFAKNVAIKRVLPHLAENKKFLAMFLDEARLSLRMNHANVVQVFDIGRSGGTYFIVMEFVDGTNLRKLMEQMREHRSRLPMAQAIFIIIEVCRGLAYAHELADAEGRNLGIVHRDVSPPNILLSRNGEVKLVDFGLAKATSQLEVTDPGVVKGKFAYLAPEAAWGREVDKRADIFACGIILWELITGERLFLGQNDVATVELVRAGEVPSLVERNRDVKPELERIVRRALAQDPADRFQTCDELAEDLAGYLFANGLKVTSFDLRRMVEGVARFEETERKVRPSTIDMLIQEEILRFSSLDESDFGEDDTRNTGDDAGAQPLNPFGFEDPRGWVGELEVGGSDTPLDIEPGEGGWRESGLYPREPSPPPRPPRRSPTPPLGNAELAPLAQMLEGEVRLTAEEPEENAGLKAAIIGISVTVGLLAVLGAVAYVLGWIP